MPNFPGVNVIDVGCADHGEFSSIRHLVDEFLPPVLIGFDPHPSVVGGCEIIEGSIVFTVNGGAWVEDGEVGYVLNDTASYVTMDPAIEEARRVRCFDLARIVRTFAPVVLKIDAEGSEYALLRHLIDAGLADAIRMLYVEWHPGAEDRDEEEIEIRAALSCPIIPWSW